MRDSLSLIVVDRRYTGAFEVAPSPPSIVQPTPISASSGLGGFENGTCKMAHILTGNQTPFPAFSTPARKQPSPSMSPPTSIRDDGWNSSGAWDDAEDTKPAPSSPQVVTTPMSKEDKAAEMARRKEERKQVRLISLAKPGSN